MGTSSVHYAPTATRAGRTAPPRRQIPRAADRERISGRSPMGAPHQGAMGRRSGVLGTPLAMAALLLSSASPLGLLPARPPAAAAAPPKRPKRLTRGDYTPLESGGGVLVYDDDAGRGATLKDGDTVTLHFTTKYNGITVTDTRQGRLLGGNRAIAVPLEFVLADQLVLPGSAAAPEIGGKLFDENTGVERDVGGLYSGPSDVRPPSGLPIVIRGMKVGGKRRALVPPELGYGSEGLKELPPDAECEVEVEILSAVQSS